MHSSAIIGWLKEEFSRRFQQKESEYLATLVWFDPNRYWLPSLPRLIEESAVWTISTKDGSHAPMNIVAVGPDIPDGTGESPLQIRLSILSDRVPHRFGSGQINWGQVKRWVIYYPYPQEYLNEAERPRKTLPFSWLMPFCEAGLEWGRGGGDEDKLPAFLRSQGVEITKDKKQLAGLYHLGEVDRARSPLSRLVAKCVDKPLEFWKGKTWDLKAVQDELVGDLNRQVEEILVAPDATVARMIDQGTVEDFLARIEDHMGMKAQPDSLRLNPSGFCRDLVRFVALVTTWRIMDYDPSYPFVSELPPPYKAERCSETIGDWLKVPEVGKVYVRECRNLEKEGLNLAQQVDAARHGHVFPHLILKQWHGVRKQLEEAAKGSLAHVRSGISELEASGCDSAWVSLLPGELGWHWFALLKEMERHITGTESCLAKTGAGDFEESLVRYSHPDAGWWRIDDAFRTLMIQAIDHPEGDLIRALAMPLYNHWVKTSASYFTGALTKHPDLETLSRVPVVKKVTGTAWCMPSHGKRKAVILMDALRYDLGMSASDLLKKAGFKVAVKPFLAGLPSKTEIGMSLLLPDCHLKVEVEEDHISHMYDGKDFGIKENRADYLRKKFGEDLKTISMKELSTGKIKEMASKILVVYSRDIDADGEAKGLGILKDVDKEISELAQKVRLLAQAGYHEIHVLTDHGFLLSSAEGVIKWDRPQGALLCERRFAIVPKNVGTELPAISFPWDKDFWLALPPAGTVFKAPGQLEYLHGGASFQESVLPCLQIEVQEQAAYVILTMLVEQETVDSGIIKIVLQGQSPVQQLPLPFMPTVVLPRSGQILVERDGKDISAPKSFEVGVGDQLNLTLFLERGLRKGDEITITAKDGGQLLSSKTLKVIRDV